MTVHAAERFPVTLQGNDYLVDVEKYRRTTVPVLREQRDQSAEAGEQSLNTQQWVRSQTDWSYGAGQSVLDNTDSDRRRFSTSSGIDPWTKGKASLLPLCESKNNAKTWTGVVARQFGTYTYVASGTDLFYSSNVTAADGSVTWTAVTALASPQTITDFTSDGTTVFIAYGSSRALASTPIGVTTQPASLGVLLPDWCRVVGGRLIVGDGNVLTELDSSGVATGLDSTSPHAGAVWVTACVGPVGIYAALNTDTGTISFVAAGSADGLLGEPQQVAQLPDGETVNDMISYGGFVILATSKGVRVAAVDTSSGGLTFGPVVDAAGAALSLTAGERFIWWGAAAGVVYRADLSRFTETLVPAWASDVVSVGDGNALGDVTDVLRVSGTTVFVDAGNGVQGEESAGVLVASGTLTVGEIRWNSQFAKVMRTVEARATPTQGGVLNEQYDTASLYDTTALYFDGDATTAAGTVAAVFSTDDGLSSDTLTLPNKTSIVVTPVLSSGSFSLTFTMTRDAVDTTTGPFLESWMVQAFPSPLRIDEIIVPVVLKRRVATSRGMGAASTVRAQTEYDTLRALMASKTVCTYEEGSRSDQVVIDQMSLAADRLSDDADWWEGTLTLRLLTVP